MQRSILAVLFVIISIAPYCQSIEPHPVLARFSFPGLVDFFDRNLTFGAEYRLNDRWSTGADAGWIFTSEYLRNRRSANGLLFRPFIRRYSRRDPEFFIETELHYKRVNYKLEDWLGRLPVNGVPSFEEYTRFTYIKSAIGFHIRFGRQMVLFRNEKLKIEPSVGIGYRFKREHAKGGIYDRGGIFTLANTNNFRTTNTLVLPINFRLCYQLR